MTSLGPAIYRQQIDLNHSEPPMKLSPTTNSPETEALFASLLDRFSSQWPHLSDKPEESAVSGIRALWLAATGRHCSVERAVEEQLPALRPEHEQTLSQLIERRLSGVPLAHLLGWQQFMGIEFKAGPQALIPRKETEILGNAALKCLRNIVRSRGAATIMDVCTGSGNLAISLAAREPACKMYAADLCPEAVELANQNRALHQLQDRVEFRVGDLFAPFGQGDFDGKMDMVVCNPPYLSTSKVGVLPPEIGQFEPKAAFDAGSFGVAIVNRLIADAPRFLKPESWLCFEVGLGQGPFFMTRLQRAGVYKTIETAADADGQIRVLIART
jgi:release factor glutamine methyltransferase